MSPAAHENDWTAKLSGPSAYEIIAFGRGIKQMWIFCNLLVPVGVCCGYDPLTGKELWRLADGVDVKIPTPIAFNDLFFLGGGSSHERNPFYAIRAGVKGEIKPDTKSIAWQTSKIRAHLVTPIVYGDYLYACTDNGILSQYHAKTGESTFRARLGSGGSFAASPVAADGKLYFASEDGDVFVIKAGPTFELLARNSMGEVVMASPAIAGRMIVIRGQKHLFGIVEK